MGEDVVLKVDAVHVKHEIIYVYVAYFTMLPLPQTVLVKRQIV